MCLYVGKVGMLKSKNSVPELLGRREIGLPLAGAKTNKSIAKHVHTRGFVLIYTFIM